jgi:hypothetical protein
VFALHSWMSELDYAVEPEVECSDDNPNDAAFVRAMTTIEGRDAVEECAAWKMYPLAMSLYFESVPVGTTAVSKLETPLSLFAVEAVATEHADRIFGRGGDKG